MAKAFENIIQQQIQLRLAELGANREAQVVREGWLAGMKLIQLLAANARYFTDSSQKPPIDVAQGDCAAGICIDFYGRAQAEAVAKRGSSRLVFVTPCGGTVNSVDPIALLRGAQHHEVAELFIEFTLTIEAQKLWNYKPGTPGGPTQYALRRQPVRKDFYEHAEWKLQRSDPEAAAFSDPDPLIYQPAWTADLFLELAFAVRVMCLDTHPELVRAWRAIIAAGMPPEALSKLRQLDALTYDKVREDIRRALASKDRSEELRLANQLGETFRRNYAEAEAEARGSSRR